MARKANPIRLAIILWLFVGAFLSGITRGQFKIKTMNGIPAAMNGRAPDPPKGAATKLNLTEVFSSGKGGTLENTFSDITDFTVHKNGTIFVLDRKEFWIKAFDPQGRFMFSFGRQGQGPGEFSQPVDILLSTLWCFLARWEKWDLRLQEDPKTISRPFPKSSYTV